MQLPGQSDPSREEQYASEPLSFIQLRALEMDISREDTNKVAIICKETAKPYSLFRHSEIWLKFDSFTDILAFWPNQPSSGTWKVIIGILSAQHVLLSPAALDCELGSTADPTVFALSHRVAQNSYLKGINTCWMTARIT